LTWRLDRLPFACTPSIRYSGAPFVSPVLLAENVAVSQASTDHRFSNTLLSLPRWLFLSFPHNHVVVVSSTLPGASPMSSFLFPFLQPRGLHFRNSRGHKSFVSKACLVPRFIILLSSAWFSRHFFFSEACRYLRARPTAPAAEAPTPPASPARTDIFRRCFPPLADKLLHTGPSIFSEFLFCFFLQEPCPLFSVFSPLYPP